MHNYHDTYNCFPPGYLGQPGANGGDCSTLNNVVPRSQGWGWAVYMLPYFDQANLYNALGVNNKQTVCDIPSGAAANIAVGDPALARTKLVSLICPSATDPDLNPTRRTTPGAPSLHGKSNYRGVAGTDFSGRNATTGLKGVFVDVTRVGVIRMRDHTDGSSNSVAIGECYRRDVDADQATFNVAPTTGEYTGGHWIGVPPDTAISAVVGQLAPTGSFALNGASINAFASPHVGGGHFLLTDGSARFISQNASQALISQLGTINDGNVTEMP